MEPMRPDRHRNTGRTGWTEFRAGATEVVQAGSTGNERTEAEDDVIGIVGHGGGSNTSGNLAEVKVAFLLGVGPQDEVQLSQRVGAAGGIEGADANLSSRWKVT